MPSLLANYLLQHMQTICSQQAWLRLKLECVPPELCVARWNAQSAKIVWPEFLGSQSAKKLSLKNLVLYGR